MEMIQLVEHPIEGPRLDHKKTAFYVQTTPNNAKYLNKYYPPENDKKSEMTTTTPISAVRPSPMFKFPKIEQ